MEPVRKPSKKVFLWILGGVISAAVLAGVFAVGFVYWGLSALGDPADPDADDDPTPGFVVMMPDADTSLELQFSERDRTQAGLWRVRSDLVPMGGGESAAFVHRDVPDRFCLLDDVYLVDRDTQLGIAVPSGTCVEADGAVIQSTLMMEP